MPDKIITINNNNSTTSPVKLLHHTSSLYKSNLNIWKPDPVIF